LWESGLHLKSYQGGEAVRLDLAAEAVIRHTCCETLAHHYKRRGVESGFCLGKDLETKKAEEHDYY
jgi:hypothetical protein